MQANSLCSPVPRPASGAGEISLPSGCRDDWQQALLQANTYRSLHSAGALLWDSEVRVLGTCDSKVRVLRTSSAPRPASFSCLQLAISAQAVADLSAQSDCQLGTLAPGVSGFSNAGYKAVSVQSIASQLQTRILGGTGRAQHGGLT